MNKYTTIFKKQLINFNYFERAFLTAPFKELDKLKELSKQNLDTYEQVHKLSIQQPDLFWSTLARSRIDWFTDFNKVTNDYNFKLTDDFKLEWFIGGKLNVSYNCVDRHYLKDPNRVALIWEQDEPGTEERLTYGELYAKMNQMANLLKSLNVQKGDRIAIYMPSSIMAVVSLLACARIGAVHNLIFAGFSAESLASRINDSECKLLITMNQAVRAGKLINLKQTVDLALEQCPTIQNVLVFKRTENDFKINKNDILIDNILNNYSTECKPEIMDSEDPLFILYTSGSTGNPKGIVHTHAGYLLHVSLSFQLIFNYKQNDVFGCLADIGWITGHSYVVYAPLSNGGTTVLFESTPNYPDPGRYWSTVERLKINQLYIAPTSLRVLNKYGDDWVNKYDRSSLKVLGSVGEPINHEAWKWYHQVIGSGKCNIADTWWQTETGGISISPLPSDDNNFKPTFAMRPFLGIEPCLLDEKGNELDRKNSKGILCLKQPWPGMGRTINGDHKRFLETYFKPFPGYYFTGDGAIMDSDGHIQITGRVDDVMNVSGHRIGTSEVECSLQQHPSVSESAVVGYPHDTLGEGIYAYIILKENVQQSESDIIKELKNLVKTKISGYAVPQKFLFIKNLPKTRSGKIMRRILRRIASNNLNDFGDITTLADPHVVDEIVERHLKNNI